MDEQFVDREVERTLASLDSIGRCAPSPGFARRVADRVQSQEEIPGWLPNLAVAVVLLLFILDGAALAWSWQARRIEMSRKELVQITRNSLWVETPSLFQSE